MFWGKRKLCLIKIYVQKYSIFPVKTDPLLLRLDINISDKVLYISLRRTCLSKLLLLN